MVAIFNLQQGGILWCCSLATLPVLAIHGTQETLAWKWDHPGFQNRTSAAW